jgi:hypothetical protein
MTPGGRFRLSIAGRDVTDIIRPVLISATFTDKVHGEADELDVTVQDKDGLWRGAWCPDTGEKASLVILDRIGRAIPCGRFEVDNPEADMGRSGDTFQIRGLAAPVTKPVRTEKTRGFENRSLGAIARTIAAEHGLRLIGTPPDVTFDRVTQRKETDLAFLSRLAAMYGAYFSFRLDAMVFAERGEVQGREPVRTFRAGTTDYIRARLSREATKTYSKAKATYFEGNTKRVIDVEVEDGAVKTGDTLKLSERLENEGQARTRAKAALDEANRKKQRAEIETEGDPLLQAGNVVALDAGFGKWAGRYLIKQSRHHETRAGYTTAITMEAVGNKEGGGGGGTVKRSSAKPQPVAQARYAPGGV